MKLVMAIIKPFKLDEVRGFGRQGGHKEIYRGAEYEVTFVPKIRRIEIAVSAEIADRAMETIRDAAGDGKIGDGKIFVLDLEQAVRIRTGDAGTGAL